MLFCAEHHVLTCGLQCYRRVAGENIAQLRGPWSRQRFQQDVWQQGLAQLILERPPHDFQLFSEACSEATEDSVASADGGAKAVLLPWAVASTEGCRRRPVLLLVAAAVLRVHGAAFIGVFLRFRCGLRICHVRTVFVIFDARFTFRAGGRFLLLFFFRCFL